MTKGIGTWLALLMLGQNIKEVGWPACGELDIMEHAGKRPDFVHSTVHNSSGNSESFFTGILEIRKPFAEFHIFGMEWIKELVDFFIDGKLARHYQQEVKNSDNRTLDKPCFLIFNVAIGGYWGGR